MNRFPGQNAQPPDPTEKRNKSRQASQASNAWNERNRRANCCACCYEGSRLGPPSSGPDQRKTPNLKEILHRLRVAFLPLTISEDKPPASGSRQALAPAPAASSWQQAYSGRFPNTMAANRFLHCESTTDSESAPTAECSGSVFRYSIAPSQNRPVFSPSRRRPRGETRPATASYPQPPANSRTT